MLLLYANNALSHIQTMFCGDGKVGEHTRGFRVVANFIKMVALSLKQLMCIPQYYCQSQHREASSKAAISQNPSFN